MVDTKTQRNKSDKETIIDMEPVKDEQKISFFKINNFILPVISILFLITISTWLILHYLPNFFQEQTYRISELSNIVQKMDKKENQNINILTQEIEILRNEIKNFDLNTSEETKFQIKNLQQSLLLVKEELEKISIKLSALEKENKQTINETFKTNSTKNKTNITENNQNLKKSENELIIEAKSIIEKLLAKKDLQSFSNEELNLMEQSYFKKIKNYLAGFFKLRQFSNDLSPRGLITKAELELQSGNLYNFLSLIKKLPNNWKEPIKDFIFKLENFLQTNDQKVGK